ncbi:unnamed protein product [Ectocarpus sp. 6 AP-2014]
MICILCEVEYENLEMHLCDKGAKSKCYRVFTSAFRGYAVQCRCCGKYLGKLTVAKAVKHAKICDPEETESETEEELNARR